LANEPEPASSRSVELYERMGERTTQPFAVHLLDRLCPLDGFAVLDVAAGTGGLAVAAANRGARITATDVSTDMVARCAERLRGFAHADAAIMDFRALAAADGEYDVAISNFGILAFAYWRVGLAELLRVTRPGGRIALTMWTQEDDCSPAHVLRRVFRRLHPDRELWPAGLFPALSLDELRKSLSQAGCSVAAVDIIEAEWTPYVSSHVVSECDPMFRGFPGYAALGVEETRVLRAGLQQAFVDYADANGTIRLPTRTFLIVAIKEV
jgi:SAM-dependent methyltransferase